MRKRFYFLLFWNKSQMSYSTFITLQIDWHVYLIQEQAKGTTKKRLKILLQFLTHKKITLLMLEDIS